jgi:hypothetical protein
LASGGSAFLVLSRRFGGSDLVVVTDLVFVAVVVGGVGGGQGIWVIEVLWWCWLMSCVIVFF